MGEEYIQERGKDSYGEKVNLVFEFLFDKEFGRNVTMIILEDRTISIL